MINKIKEHLSIHPMRKSMVIAIIIEWILLYLMFAHDVPMNFFILMSPFIIVIIDTMHRWGYTVSSINITIAELNKNLQNKNRLDSEKLLELLQMKELNTQDKDKK